MSLISKLNVRATLIPLGILFPIFFQIGSGVFVDPNLNFSSGGLLKTLPLPVAILVCYAGILSMRIHRQTQISLWHVISTCGLMALSAVLLTISHPEWQKDKFLLLIQFALPMGAIVLGQMYGERIDTENRRLYEKVFLLVLIFIVPIQLYFTFKLGIGFLSPNVGLFVIYQSLQYVPVIFVTAFILALFSLWQSKKWRIALIAFFPLMAIYTSASISRLAIIFFLTGLSVFAILQFKRHSEKLPAVLLIFALAINYGYFQINKEKLTFKFSIAAAAIDPQAASPAGRVGLAPNSDSSEQLFENSKSVTERLTYWKYYGQSITADAKSFFLGVGPTVDREKYPSAHNYYLDFIYNFGVVALLPTLLLIGYTIAGLIRYRKDVFESNSFLALSLVVLFLILADNSLKVGMRQPYPGIFTFFLWGILLARMESLRSKLHK